MVTVGYIIYKADNCWTGWTEGFPGAVFSATESGWFTFFTFEDWFRKVFLPYRRRHLTGKVVLIGDNLRTHLSLDVIQLCGQGCWSRSQNFHPAPASTGTGTNTVEIFTNISLKCFLFTLNYKFFLQIHNNCKYKYWYFLCFN